MLCFWIQFDSTNSCEHFTKVDIFLRFFQSTYPIIFSPELYGLGWVKLNALTWKLPILIETRPTLRSEAQIWEKTLWRKPFSLFVILGRFSLSFKYIIVSFLKKTFLFYRKFLWVEISPKIKNTHLKNSGQF